MDFFFPIITFCRLVSTDVIARGIDIPQVNYVISYDPPKYVRGYVHRAGRTGRAGMLGTVLTLTTPSQVSYENFNLKKTYFHEIKI